MLRCIIPVTRLPCVQAHDFSHEWLHALESYFRFASKADMTAAMSVADRIRLTGREGALTGRLSTGHCVASLTTILAH
jgi:hypothetical protein